MYSLSRDKQATDSTVGMARPADATAAPAAPVPAPALRPVPDAPPQVQAALRRVVEQLALEMAPSRNRMLTVTAARSGDGVSSVAWWLLCTLAAAGPARLLLVDASASARALPAGAPEPLLQRVRASSLSGVSTLVLPAGAGSAAEASPDDNLHAALDTLRAQFDWIVVDAAPPSESAGTLRLARASNGVLLVVRANHTERQDLQTTVNLITRAEGRVVGAVLNRTRG